MTQRALVMRYFLIESKDLGNQIMKVEILVVSIDYLEKRNMYDAETENEWIYKRRQYEFTRPCACSTTRPTRISWGCSKDATGDRMQSVCR